MNIRANTMKRAHLNHALNASKNNWFASAVLIFGCVIFGAALIYFQQLSAKGELLTAEIAALSVAKSPALNFGGQVNATQDANKNAELVAVNKAIAEIMLPWEPLFKALENANQDNVKMLSVEPNLKNNSVQIVAVAMNFESMSAYIAKLNEQTKFKSVNLISNEAMDVNGQAATQFKLNLVLN